MKNKLWASWRLEKKVGTIFSLDIFLWTDFEKCTVNDDIKTTVDYSKLVQILKDQSKIYCLQSKIFKRNLEKRLIRNLSLKLKLF